MRQAPTPCGTHRNRRAATTSPTAPQTASSADVVRGHAGAAAHAGDRALQAVGERGQREHLAELRQPVGQRAHRDEDAGDERQDHRGERPDARRRVDRRRVRGDRHAERRHRRGAERDVDRDADEGARREVHLERDPPDGEQRDHHRDREHDRTQHVRGDERPRSHRRAAEALQLARLPLGRDRDRERREALQHDRVRREPGREVRARAHAHVMERVGRVAYPTRRSS